MGWIVPILIVVVLGVAVYALLRKGKVSKTETTQGRALEILVERWCRGEISTEVFREMKKELETLN